MKNMGGRVPHGEFQTTAERDAMDSRNHGNVKIFEAQGVLVRSALDVFPLQLRSGR
jgi:hypothetical protein